MLGSALRKAWMLFLQKTNQARLIDFLEINASDPTSIHLYGKVDFGSEPWIISIGRNVYLTDGVKFITHDGGTLLFRDAIPDLEITKPIILGDNVYIGNNVLLLPGVRIGSNVIVGAGSVVTKSIPSNEVWGGCPAHKIKSTDEYLDKAKRDSLHLGNLVGRKKDAALRRLFDVKSNR